MSDTRSDPRYTISYEYPQEHIGDQDLKRGWTVRFCGILLVTCCNEQIAREAANEHDSWLIEFTDHYSNITDEF